jgi:hypothetical protein
MLAGTVAFLAAVLIATSALAAPLAKKGGGNGGGGGGGGGPQPTATPEPCSGCPEMHVDFMVVTYGSTQDTYGVCRASIVDEFGSSIDGVDVTFDLSEPFAGQYTVTQVLGQNGDQARLEQRRRERYSCGKRGIPETMTCTVVGVYHPDYTYTPSLNNETTDSDSCSN